MPEQHSYSYAVIRLVPRVEREEFINVGVMIYSQMAGYLKARFHLDEKRIAALWPSLSLDEVRQHLEAFCAVARGESGPIGSLAATERFHWLAATRSTMLQASPVHTGVGNDFDARLQKLMDAYVLKPT